MARASIRLLGGFEVAIDGAAIPRDAWKQRRGADVVKLLALAPSRRLHREQMTEALWPDLAPEAAAANLRKAVHHARRALGSDDLITTDGGSLALSPIFEIDVERFDHALRTGDSTAAAGLYAGELLPEDRFAPWTQDDRERLRMRALDALRAAGSWERMLELDRANEEAYRALMRRELDAGNRTAAMRHFERLREVLRADLGVGPDPTTVTLYEEVLAMEGEDKPSELDRCRSLLAWALVHWNQGDLDEAERTAEQARLMAIELEYIRELGEASALVGMVSAARGLWRDVFRTEFVEWVSRPPEMAATVFNAHLCLAEYSLYTGEGYDAITAFASELLDIAAKGDSVQGTAIATLMFGEAGLFAGKLDEAEHHLGKAAQLHAQANATSGAVLAMQRLAEVAIERGQRWRARRILGPAQREMLVDPLAPHLVPRVFATLIAAAKDPIPVVGDAELAVAADEACAPCSMGFHVNASIALARAGLLDRARTHLDHADRIAGMWQGGPWVAAVWETRAEIRRASGDETQAIALYKEAAELFARAQRPMDADRCTAAAG